MKRIDIGLGLQVAAAVALVIGLKSVADNHPLPSTATEDSGDFWQVMNQSESGVELFLSIALVVAVGWLVTFSPLGKGKLLPGPVNDFAVLAVGAGAIYLLYRF